MVKKGCRISILQQKNENKMNDVFEKYLQDSLIHLVCR